MRRRDVLRLFLGGAAAIVFERRAARAQVPARRVIAVLSPLSAAAGARNISALRSGLRDLGFVEGRNVEFVLRFGDGALNRIPLLAQELVALKPDVIVVGSQAAAAAAQEATRTIPIVVTTPQDPVASGLAKSIARPGGNVTGTWTFGDDALVGKRLEFLQLAVPNISRVGVLLNTDDPTDAIVIPRLPAAGKSLGLSFEVFAVRDLSKLDEVSAPIARSGVQALFVGQGPTFNSARRSIAAIVSGLRLPAVYGWREFADAGGLMSYGPNLPDMYRQAARLVGRILKGANPGDLPIELPTRYELVVNLKAANAIGFKVSDSFLLLADEVIE